MKKTNTPRVLTTHQVAARLGIHYASVIRWVDQGRLKAYRTPGGHRRILFEELQKFMKEYGLPDLGAAPSN